MLPDLGTSGRPCSVPRIGATIVVDMPLRMTRDHMIDAPRDLPADATVDDAIERLMFLAKIEAGMAELDRGEGVTHEEVKRRLGV